MPNVLMICKMILPLLKLYLVNQSSMILRYGHVHRCRYCAHSGRDGHKGRTRDLHIGSRLPKSTNTCPAPCHRAGKDSNSSLLNIERVIERYKSIQDQLIGDLLENLKTNLDNCLKVFKDAQKAISFFLTTNGEAATGKWKGFFRATFKKDDVLALQKTLNSYKCMNLNTLI